MAAINQGVNLSRLEVERVTVTGVGALRMIAEEPAAEADGHREVYFLAGERQVGVVVCVSSPADARAYASRFAGVGFSVRKRDRRRARGRD